MPDINPEIYQLLSVHIDEKYRNFALKLLPDGTNMLGVQLPILRRMARKVIRYDWQNTLSQLTDTTFEERLLYGMITAYAPIDVSTKIPLISNYLLKMNNWSLCDSFCVSFKLTDNDKKILLPFIKECLKSPDEYVVRFGIVMLLNFYIGSNLAECFKLFSRVLHRGYYVTMAIAWAVSMCYIRFPKETRIFLSNNQLDKLIQNKAVQKIRESNCLPESEKDFVLRFKRQ